MREVLVTKIRAFFRKAGEQRVVIGVSGGIDSAVSLVLVAEALGPENATALIMPEHGVTKKSSTADAIAICKRMQVQHVLTPINPFLKVFKRLPWPQTRVGRMNLKARVRMLLLYNFANSADALVVGTSNKTELLLGYFTKFGDGACDVEVIGSLYKTEVCALAKELRLPTRFLTKKPSAELRRGQSDEIELGMGYPIIDRALHGKGNQRVVHKIRELRSLATHKQSMPPIL